MNRQVRNNYSPTTISLEAQQMLKAMYDTKAYPAQLPAFDDLEGWRKTHDAGEKDHQKLNHGFQNWCG